MYFMRLLMVSGILCLLVAPHVISAEEKKERTKKLQIGIKKRVDNCKVKSRKGDMLHMHYTVSHF